MSPRRASLPPPLPPLRACPDTSPRLRSGVPGQTLAAPSRSRRGHKYNKQTIKTLNTCATIIPSPTPSPASRLPGHVPSLSLGPCPVRRSLPPPAPGGGFNYISPYLWHNYCVSAPPSPGRFFFPLLGHSPGSMPRFASAWAQASALAKVFRLRTP